MKKWFILLCGMVVFCLGSCTTDNSIESSLPTQSNVSSTEQSENVSSAENNSLTQQSENVENLSNSSVSTEREEGGGDSLVNGYYVFNTYEEYAQFYQEFVKLNEERYYAPIISIDEKFDTTNYIFEVSPIPYSIANNNLYVGVEFPQSQKLSFNFSKTDFSEVGVHKSVTVRGKVFNVSDEGLIGDNAVLVQMDNDGRNYNVYLGEIILCSFEIAVTGYDNKVEYLELIERGFIFN